MQWTPDSPPELHPLWEEQVAIERGMLRQGANRFRDGVIKAEQKGNLAGLAPLRSLINEWLPGVAQALGSWLKDVEASRGVRPIAYPYLKDVDRHMAALVALRTIINRTATHRSGITSVAMEIGRTIEYEQRVRLWEEQEPKLFYAWQHEQDRKKVTEGHRRHVNINRFNKLAADHDFDSIQWDNWSEEAIFRTGIALIDVVVRKTGQFRIEPDPEYVPKAGKFKQKLVLTAAPGFVEWLVKAFDHHEEMAAEFQPCVMPPKRWTGTRQGGYWTPYVRAPRLIRFKASQESQKERAADEYDALDMPQVYDALHVLQETAWRVNGRVLDVMTALWAKDTQLAGLPKVGAEDLPARTPRMYEHAEACKLARERNVAPPEPDEQTAREIREWKRKATLIHTFNAKRDSLAFATSQTVLIAERYRNYDAIYFPYMLDFRGRMYPIPNFLHPQGNDIARGLLTFAKGVRVTSNNGGIKWLAIHLASAWGIDKESYEVRVRWVKEREALWRRIAEDPIANTEWTVTEGPNKVDKPWQALAAIFEWVACLDHGEGYLSYLPVMVDGTCNGIQHLSAITRDAVAGAYVNLVPGPKPSDIYKFVAGELQATLERISRNGGPEGEKADFWLDLCGHDLPRSLTKRQVMVLPYGGTKQSFFDYTRLWLDETQPATEHTTPEDFEFRRKCTTFLALHMWDAVNVAVRGAMQVMEWLKACAKVAAEENQPIYWVTPAGFVVRHFYGLERPVLCKLLLNGEKHRLTRVERTAKLSVREQLQGIAPNFIHSLDAAALVLCLKKCLAEGIEFFSSVHDAYGTHAGNMDALSEMLREAFVEVHHHDVLAEFRSACQRVLVSALVIKKGYEPLEASEKAHEMLPPLLEMGDLDLHEVLHSPYFFA